MKKPTPQTNSSGFKSKVALAAIEVQKTLAELVKPFHRNPHHITASTARLHDGAAGMFGSGTTAAEEVPLVDLKLLRSKTGELALEKHSLSGALIKAGLLSAKQFSTAFTSRC